ncbi:GGDEF domain-containing protein [Neopusillimonas aromaticivorans]|nr:GGDEF domain-containing protein [Neopusillimonas aromaticivorans]WJJ94478.1 GGDEF domain-containing protein [Neopusillimonas aromaticivorans]
MSERVKREARLLHEASEDKLTALYNRRYGEKLLAEAHQRARALGTDLTLIVCDIDFFKQVNDRFGHLAGDQVIMDVATILRGTVRASDAVIRWGAKSLSSYLTIVTWVQAKTWPSACARALRLIVQMGLAPSRFRAVLPV